MQNELTQAYLRQYLSWSFLAVNYFGKTFHHRCLTDSYTAQKMTFSIKYFFSKCDQIRSFLRIWSHFLKKSLIENVIFCAVLNAFLKLFFNNCFLWIIVAYGHCIFCESHFAHLFKISSLQVHGLNPN